MFFLIGLLTVSVGEETVSNVAEKVKTSSDNVGDIVMLEIDVKEPVKRSPISATAEYGAPANQYILQSADNTQEVVIDCFIIHAIVFYEILLLVQIIAVFDDISIRSILDVTIK